jgi:hypothetical protein
MSFLKVNEKSKSVDQLVQPAIVNQNQVIFKLYSSGKSGT